MNEYDPQEARNLGYKSYKDGVMARDNPFNNKDQFDLHVAWKIGFFDAAFELFYEFQALGDE